MAQNIEYPRTIIFRLTEKQYEFLRRFAESRNEPVSEIAREIIEASRQKTEFTETHRGSDGEGRKKGK